MINTKDKKRIRELKELISKYDKQYYELGVSDISDAEYDRLYDEYLAFEKKYPELKSNTDAPTKRVGAGKEAGASTALPKFEHKSPLLSIDRKAKDMESLKDFFEKCGGEGTTFIVEPKLDGITCNINYEDGRFVNAATRGNGYVGDLITKQFQNTDTVYPKNTPDNTDIEIRGEAIIPFDYFKKKLSKDYSNPRNAVSGIMRQVEPKEVKGKGVQVMFYDLGRYNYNDFGDSDLENISKIKKLGFQSVPVMKATSWEELKYIVKTHLGNQIQQIDGFNVLVSEGYPQAVCDGLVIKVDSYAARNKIGMSEKGPKWAFAFKFKPLQVETIIHNVEWQVGNKTGRLTPVGIFEEVSLGGTKITRATLNNYDYMKNLPVLNIITTASSKTYEQDVSKPIGNIMFIQKGDILRDSKYMQSQGEDECEYIKVGDATDDGFWIDEPTDWNGEWYQFESNRFYLQTKGIHVGDKIIVERSNDVIPRIVAIKEHYKDNSKMNNSSFEVPKVCPDCGHLIEEKYPLHFCTNPMCPSQMKGRIEHYASRDAMNIVGLGEAIVDIFFKKGFLTDLSSIYHLSEYREELESLPKFGKKKVENLLNSIEKSKNPELWQFIYALCINGVGKKASKDLAQHYLTLENFLKANFDNLCKMPDIGGITAQGIVDFITDESAKEMIQKLLDAGVAPQEVEVVGDKFSGMTFVITGTLQNSRKYYQEIIEKNGGKVVGSVSKKTTAVLIGTDAGSKEEKARKLVSEGADIKLLDSEESIMEFLD